MEQIIISDDSLLVVPDNSVKKETSEVEFQTGLAVLQKMDETILNKRPKTELTNIKPKIEPKEESNIKNSSRDIKYEPIEIISDDSLFIVQDNSVKKETSEAEFQTGLVVIEEMDETIFNKKPKAEPLNIKPEI